MAADFNPWALEDEKRSITVKAGTVGVVKDVEQSPSLPPIRQGTVLVDFQNVQFTRYVFPAQVQRLLTIVSPATRHKTRRRTREEDAPPAQENEAQVTDCAGRQDAPAARPHKQFRGRDFCAHTQMPHCSSLSPTCSASAAVGDERAEGRAPASASAKGANGRASARTSAEDICPHQCIRSRSKECARGGTLASTSAEGADARSAARRRMSRCRPGSPCAQRRSEPRGRWAYRPSVTS